MAGILLVGRQREMERLARASCDALDLRYARYSDSGGTLDALQHRILYEERAACVSALEAFDAAADDASRWDALQELVVLRDRVRQSLGALHCAQLERVEHMHCFALHAACPPEALARAMSPESVGDDRLSASLSDESVLASLREKIERRQAREVSADGLEFFETPSPSTVVSVNGLLSWAYRDIFAEANVAALGGSRDDLHYLFGAEPGSLNGRLSGYAFETNLCAFLGSTKEDEDLGEKARTALREFAEESAIQLPDDLASDMQSVFWSALNRLRRTRPRFRSAFVPTERSGPIAGVWIKQNKARRVKTLFVLRVGEGMRLRDGGEDVTVEHLGVAGEVAGEAGRTASASSGGTIYVPPHLRGSGAAS